MEDEISISIAAEMPGIGAPLAEKLAKAGSLPGVYVVEGGLSVWRQAILSTVYDLPNQRVRAQRRKMTDLWGDLDSD